jgi:alkaline phosphatase D
LNFSFHWGIDMVDTSKRDFLTKSAQLVSVAGTVGLAACGNSPTTLTQFLYGVASGDPTPDSVILWTHAKVNNLDVDVLLNWEIALDADFKNIINSGSVMASQSAGNTAKVDATKLSAGTSYFYRFSSNGYFSPTGTTRTLPKSSETSVKFAVFSCSLYSSGFFNVYDAAAKSAAQYAIHLGDYIYEYGSDPSKFGNSNAVSLGRVTTPSNDIMTLSDYRTRYASYRSDPNLQALHAKMPWITVWDDHEFANNAWVDGAENHNSTTQGDWYTRKAIAAKVYHEWMPIRTPDINNLLKIYRRFDFGNLFTLHMVDTRIEGRDKQYDAYGDADGGTTRYVTALTNLSDSTHRMMSTTQQKWLTDGIIASTAPWQIMGNQDVMARMWFPYSVVYAQSQVSTNPTGVATAINAFLTAKATPAAYRTPTQSALISTTSNPRLPYNLDSWDGYPLQRESILQTIKAANKKLVTISGDSHNAWFNNLTTLANDKVGVEFAGSSVTAPGFESAGLGELASSLDGSIVSGSQGSGLGLIDDLNYADTKRRGYLLMTVTASNIVGEYIFVDTVLSKSYTPTVGKTVTVTSDLNASYT